MPPKLVIFDCDGVLIDSELVASRVAAEELTALGWPMTTEQSMALFMGMSITDMEPIIEHRIGRKLPPGWRQRIAADFVTALGREAKLIEGAKEILETMNEIGMDWRIASNSSDEEMAAKFHRTGLTALTAGRYHSAAAVIALGGRPKPAPDVFLAAAASAGAAPSDCLVLEDSVPGVTGAVAAGMTCYGFSPHGDGAQLTAAGAIKILTNLNKLPGELT
jgi:beta-phosphoglucomutase-like phosphatase (HAD superfamily)